MGFMNYLGHLGSQAMEGLHQLPVGHEGGILHHLGIGHDRPHEGGNYLRQMHSGGGAMNAPAAGPMNAPPEKSFVTQPVAAPPPIAGPDTHPDDPEVHGLSSPFADAIGGLRKLTMGWYGGS